MKQLISSVIVIAFLIISCSQDGVLPPGYKNPHGCLIIDSDIPTTRRNVHINSISRNKNWAIGYAGLSQYAQSILDLKNNKLYPITIFTKEYGMKDFSFLDPYTSSFPFCPYDGNKFFGGFYIYNSKYPHDKDSASRHWGIFDLENKRIDTVQIYQNGVSKNPIDLYWINYTFNFIRPIKWLNKSKLGDDYLYFDDNTVLHLQTNTWSEGIPNLDITVNDKVVSLSPDDKIAVVFRGSNVNSPIGYTTLNNTKLFVNENIISSSKYHSVLSWSDDSKYVIVWGSLIENNHGKPVYYIYEVDANFNLKLKRTIDIVKNYCAYNGSHKMNFLTDSTLLISINPLEEEYGTLFEIRLDGSMVRKIDKLNEY